MSYYPRESSYERPYTPPRRPSPGIAAVLSVLIPGLGQVYNGRLLAGAIWFLLTAFGYWAVLVPGFLFHVLSVVFAYRGAKNTARGLAARMSDDTELAGVDATHLPSEEVSQFIQRHWNHFSELEAAAENIRRAGQLGEAYSDAERLRHYLQTKLGVRVEVGDSEALGGAVRRFDKGASCLRLSHMLSPRSRRFQMAHVVGLITQENVIRSLAQDSRLSSDEARTLGRVALANYFAAALLMPYDTFLETAKAERYDLERLGHRFDSSYEQVCHRLTSLQRPGAKGVPFHMVRVDIAGNLSKRFSSSGIHFARFAGACPRWNIYHAFLTPGRVRTQISTMPDGTTYFCVARTIERGGAGYHAAHTMHAIGLGCKVEHASALVYADGIDLESKGIPVGVTCRTCERMNCVQRAMPPLQYPLAVDELVRGLSFYAPASAE